MFICLCENEKSLGMISPSYCLEIDVNRTHGYRLLNKVNWLCSILINNGREVLFLTAGELFGPGC